MNESDTQMSKGLSKVGSQLRMKAAFELYILLSGVTSFLDAIDRDLAIL